MMPSHTADETAKRRCWPHGWNRQVDARERFLKIRRRNAALGTAKARGVKLGGQMAGSERSQQEAAALAGRMRPVITQLANLSSSSFGGAKPA